MSCNGLYYMHWSLVYIGLYYYTILDQQQNLRRRWWHETMLTSLHNLMTSSFKHIRTCNERTDFEGRRVEGGDGQTRAVDCNAIAKLGGEWDKMSRVKGRVTWQSIKGTFDVVFLSGKNENVLRVYMLSLQI